MMNPKDSHFILGRGYRHWMTKPAEKQDIFNTGSSQKHSKAGMVFKYLVRCQFRQVILKSKLTTDQRQV